MVPEVAAIPLLLASRGVPKVVSCVLCATGVALALWMPARITNSGVDLGLLIPQSAERVPIATKPEAIFIFHESGSPLNVLVALVACSFIGVARHIV